MMIPASSAVGQLLLPGGSTVAQLLVSALAFTAWDLFLDPQMVLWDFWRWEKPGRYFGIPLINFFGWFLCGLLALLALRALLPTAACYLPVWPLFGVYVLTWFFQTTAQLAFWGLYGSGIVGFLGMGLFILLVIV
jgi:putative membrane protein